MCINNVYSRKLIGNSDPVIDHKPTCDRRNIPKVRISFSLKYKTNGRPLKRIHYMLDNDGLVVDGVKVGSQTGRRPFSSGGPDYQQTNRPQAYSFQHV